MFASVEGTTLSVGMLYYGYFLSFGVAPSSKTLGLSEEVALNFGVQPGYIFNRRDGKPGIAAKRFYPRNLSEQIQEIVGSVIQKIEL